MAVVANFMAALAEIDAAIVALRSVSALDQSPSSVNRGVFEAASRSSNNAKDALVAGGATRLAERVPDLPVPSARNVLRGGRLYEKLQAGSAVLELLVLRSELVSRLPSADDAPALVASRWYDAEALARLVRHPATWVAIALWNVGCVVYFLATR